MAERKQKQRGAVTVEYALAYLAVILPLTFGVIYTAELLWIWHSTAEFTRAGARYAATHCWQSSGENVLNYMRTNAPLMVDRNQFTDGTAQLAITYYSRDAETGALTEFSCDGECSVACVPDTVTVAVRNYEFRYFQGYLGLPPVLIPNF